MNFTSLFAMLAQNQLTKAALFLARHVEGTDKGNALVASDNGQQTLQMASGVAGSLLASHINADAVAKTLGVNTTEQAIAHVIFNHALGCVTLSPPQQAVVTQYLGKNS